MDVLLQDLRYALRSLRRSPGYTATVVAIMALGIGINTMVFSIVYAVLFRPLPIHDPDRIVSVETIDPKRGEDEGFEVSYSTLRRLRSEANTVSSVGGLWDHNAFITIGKEPERLFAATVTSDLFKTLGVEPMMGRGFVLEEEVWDKNWATVIISHKVWTERYQSDPEILGKTLRINGRTRTIIGVMPPGFRFPEIQDFWIPNGYDPKDEKPYHFSLQTFARLKPGVSAKQANAEIATILSAVAKDNPKEMEGMTGRALPIREAMVNDIRPLMLVLLAAVVFVLLIACTNVANLMLARSFNRRREIGLRLAVGASRGRIVRQLLTESVAISAAGAGLGILLAHWGNRLWTATIPVELPMWLDMSIDTPVLIYTVLVSTAAGLLFGIAPAFHASDTQLGESLRDGSAQAGASRGRNRLRAGLVVAEVALSLVLLVGAGLMIRSFMRIQDLKETVRTEGVLTGSVLLPYATYPEEDQKRAYFRDILPRIRAIPGVTTASAIQFLPINDGAWRRRVMPSDAKDMDRRTAPITNFGIVFPDYFRTVGIPIKSGRDFTDNDQGEGRRVAIVSENLAHVLWPGKDPIGRTLLFPQMPDSFGTMTVVGVVGDIVQSYDTDGEQELQARHVYVPHNLEPHQWMTFVAHTNGETGPLAEKIRAIVRSPNPDLALVDVRTMAEHIDYEMWMKRIFTSLFMTFAILALIIAAVGIYGVMAYSVTQRTREIGIRMALGADQAAVVRMIVGQAMRLTVIGAGIGLAGAYALTRVMASMLFRVNPDDPPTFAGVAVILTFTALIAAWLPARKAATVDPMLALRSE